uniref:Uncharacterized protein n=1 Tax=Clytia hemisphaerica TaxID=252671 RepID=A0A7M5VF09_9CNID
FFFNNGYSHNAVQYANGGFPGRATTQYTSVHHQSISHDDGDADGYVDGGAGYVGGAAAAVPAVSAGYVTGGAVPAAGYLGGASVVGSRYAGSGYLARSYHPRHVHVGVGTPGVKVEVETAKSVITSKPVHVTGQKMSEIKNIVKDVTASLAKTSKKLKSLKTGAKRQITPAFTPVVSEPVGVPSNRYPVPAADRYPLGAGYIWPSANYGHQYGGPYSWSKSHTPKAAPAVAAKPSTAKTSKKSNTKKSNIEQASEEQQQQQYAPSSRSMMPDPMYSNEQEQYAPESQYEMQQRMQPEYMSAKKSSVPKKANH